MTASTTFATELLEHLLENASVPLIGDGSGLQGSSVAGSLYLGLHTADPGAGGAQTANEANYTGYARLAIPRTSGVWNIANATATNALKALFQANSGAGTVTVTHISVGTAASGAGKVLLRAAVTVSQAVGPAKAPKFEPGQLTFIVPTA